MKDKLPKAGKIGAGSGDIDPSWNTIPGGNIDPSWFPRPGI